MQVVLVDYSKRMDEYFWIKGYKVMGHPVWGGSEKQRTMKVPHVYSSIHSFATV